MISTEKKDTGKRNMGQKVNGQFIKFLRNYLQKSQLDMANELLCSTSAICRIEKKQSKKPTELVVKYITEGLGIELERFYEAQASFNALSRGKSLHMMAKSHPEIYAGLWVK